MNLRERLKLVKKRDFNNVTIEFNSKLIMKLRVYMTSRLKGSEVIDWL